MWRLNLGFFCELGGVLNSLLHLFFKCAGHYVKGFFYYVIRKVSDKSAAVDVVIEYERSANSDLPFAVEPLLQEVRHSWVSELFRGQLLR